jgi:hypothetical protein
MRRGRCRGPPPSPSAFGGSGQGGHRSGLARVFSGVLWSRSCERPARVLLGLWFNENDDATYLNRSSRLRGGVWLSIVWD